MFIRMKNNKLDYSKYFNVVEGDGREVVESTIEKALGITFFKN